MILFFHLAHIRFRHISPYQHKCHPAQDVYTHGTDHNLCTQCIYRSFGEKCIKCIIFHLLDLPIPAASRTFQMDHPVLIPCIYVRCKNITILPRLHRKQFLRIGTKHLFVVCHRNDTIHIKCKSSKQRVDGNITVVFHVFFFFNISGDKPFAVCPGYHRKIIVFPLFIKPCDICFPRLLQHIFYCRFTHLFLPECIHLSNIFCLIHTIQIFVYKQNTI